MSAPTVSRGVPSRETSLVAIMFFAAGIVFLDRFGITYLFPQIGADLQLSNSQLGSLVSITALTWAISSLLFSIISDRFAVPVKPIIVASLILFSVTVGFVGLAPNFGTMLVLRALIGFFEGPALPLIQSAVRRASAPQRRGRNMGIVIAGTAVIGSALAPSIMIGLVHSLGWRMAFPIVCVPGIAVAILVGIFMPSELTRARGERNIRARDFKLVIANRNVLLALIGSIVCIGYTIGFTAFAPEFLSQHGLTPGLMTLVLTVQGISGAIGNVVAPWVSDRIGRKPALLIAAICMGLVPLFFVLFVDQVALLLISMVVGLMAGGTLALITYVVPGESVPPELTATTFALQIAVGETLGGVLGPQIGGAIADSTGNLSDSLLFYAAAPVLVVIVALLIHETAPRRRTTVPGLQTAIQETEEGVLP